MAAGKQGRYYTQSFNANKTNYIEIAYFIYLKCYKLSAYVGQFEHNNINSDKFKAIDKNNYSKIIADLECNNVIKVNNSYSVKRFSKSYTIHKDMLVALNNSKYTLKHSNSISIDITNFAITNKNLLTPSSIICDPTYNEQENKIYKRTIKECDIEMTFYSKLTYDEQALIEFCDGDDLLENTLRIKLKDLSKPPRVVWNRYYHLFHTLGKEFREHVLRFNGKKLFEVFDIPGSDLHMLAKALEKTDVKEKELIKFQKDVKQDFRKLFGTCKKTGKATKTVKTAFKKYLFQTKECYDNIRKDSTVWYIDQYFQENYPNIREQIIEWGETDISGKTTKSLWADMMMEEFETVSVRLSSLLYNRKHMYSFTCHDAVYLTEDDAEEITENEIKEMFYEALDLLIDRQENFFNL